MSDIDRSSGTHTDTISGPGPIVLADRQTYEFRASSLTALLADVLHWSETYGDAGVVEAISIDPVPSGRDRPSAFVMTWEPSP